MTWPASRPSSPIEFMFATFPFVIFVMALGGFVARGLGVDDPSGRIIDAISGDLPPIWSVR